MGITADIQTLEPGRLIELFEVDCSSIGGDILRFHGHLQTASIFWQGNEYKAWPVEGKGFARSSDAQQSTPSLTVGDIDGTVSAMCVYLDDMVGAYVRRHRTLSKYLDAVNFPEGNPTADPTAEMPIELWRIESKPEELPGQQVTFSLASPLDFGGQQLPAFQLVRICQFDYRGPECGYTGTAYFDANDQPVDNPLLDRCSFQTTGCECRFGTGNPLPFGGALCDVLQS
jgi:lambda family phage minor tail protein L